MKKRILGTIIAAGLVAATAFAGANGWTETQAACEHSLVKDGTCVDCNDPVECIELEDSNGAVKGKYTTIEAAAAASGSGDVLKLLNNCESTAGYIDAGYKSLTIDLDQHQLTVGQFTIQGSLTVENGRFNGYINNTSVGNSHILIFDNVKAQLPELGWYAKDGVKLVNSNIEQQHDPSTVSQWWLEKLEMDQASVYKITDSMNGLRNYGNLSLDEALGSIEEFLPAGYTLGKDSASIDNTNTILDENGNIARSVELRYRRLTDASVTVSLDPTSYVYDGTAKEPAVTVTYDGKKLTAGTDYICVFADNIDVGTASVTITAQGKTYHGETVQNYTIEKAPQAAPTGLASVKESAKGKKDGSVINVDAAMEYSADQASWTSVTGTAIGGLASGDYFVRYKETKNYYASPATKVTVGLAASGTTEASTTESDTTEASTTESSTTENDTTEVTTTESETSEITTTEADDSEDITTEEKTDDRSAEELDTEDKTTETVRKDKTEAADDDKDKKEQKKTGVKTGDTFAMGAAAAGMLISLGVACMIVIRKRRK